MHFIGGACVWPIGTGLVLWFGAMFAFGNDPIGRSRLARRVDLLRRRRADRLGVSLHAAGIAALSGDPRPRQGSARHPWPARHCRRRPSRCRRTRRATPRAIRSGSCSRSFRRRVIAGMICFSAFFGVAIGLGAWLPEHHECDKGFTITKSLQYTPGMNFAVPCASICMMYTLDKFGPQNHVGLRLHRRRHHGRRVRQCGHSDRNCWSPASS